jgi:hypothetical protein
MSKQANSKFKSSPIGISFFRLEIFKSDNCPDPSMNENIISLFFRLFNLLIFLRTEKIKYRCLH